jgi:hypothetical protein
MELQGQPARTAKMVRAQVLLKSLIRSSVATVINYAAHKVHPVEMARMA